MYVLKDQLNPLKKISSSMVKRLTRSEFYLFYQNMNLLDLLGFFGNADSWHSHIQYPSGVTSYHCSSRSCYFPSSRAIPFTSCAEKRATIASEKVVFEIDAIGANRNRYISKTMSRSALIPASLSAGNAIRGISAEHLCKHITSRDCILWHSSAVGMRLI